MIQENLGPVPALATRDPSPLERGLCPNVTENRSSGEAKVGLQQECDNLIG
ncbi:hypothetical protein [Methanosphaerula subterraneus]|uniref:hypothetical protein n=1 Tax=Methanosphaerula subterraneus TaxID=3350244 RepID=UPI003F834410